MLRGARIWHSRQSPVSRIRTRPDGFVVAKEAQEAVLVSGLPRELCSSRALAAKLSLPSSAVLVAQTRLREPLYKACVLARHEVSSAFPLPVQCTMLRLDETDLRVFLEQYKRFHSLSEDLRSLATPEYFMRTVTLTGVPRSYTVKDVCDLMIEKLSAVPVKVVFPFSASGIQSEMAFVVLPSEELANKACNVLREVAVPIRKAYGASFGCSFIDADRSFLFASHTDGSLDYSMTGSRFWVASFGWGAGLSIENFVAALNQFKIFPDKVVPLGDCPASDGIHEKAMIQPSDAPIDTSSFLIRFHSMEATKNAIKRLNELKNRWGMDKHVPLYAYPKVADVHFFGDSVHVDKREDLDFDDIDEPLNY